MLMPYVGALVGAISMQWFTFNNLSPCFMKQLLLFLCAALIAAPAFAGTKGENVFGKIQIVDSFPDYKVRIVKSFPDLKVQVVDSFPDQPGKWRLVKSLPDYKIQFVKSGEDFTIQYVTAFPGVQ
jgi:hypothetical protein